MDHAFATPIALLIFNRPEPTSRVFAEIACQKPKRLLIVADGPRESRPGEVVLCQQAREIVGRVDWDCEVSTNFSDVNLGCKQRVASGLDWVFSQVEEAIILEDDCVLHPTAFEYCRQLLDRYRDDPRVMHISCANFTQRRDPNTSYHFSRYPHVWGWASWRRAWQRYDVTMRAWREADDPAQFLRSFEGKSVRRFWKDIWDRVSAGEIDTWDYQWSFACLAHYGLTITPNVNLVSNIGFGVDATHTTDPSSKVNGMQTDALRFPLRHPDDFSVDVEADRIIEKMHYMPPPFWKRSRSAAYRFALKEWQHLQHWRSQHWPHAGNSVGVG